MLKLARISVRPGQSSTAQNVRRVLSLTHKWSYFCKIKHLDRKKDKGLLNKVPKTLLKSARFNDFFDLA